MPIDPVLQPHLAKLQDPELRRSLLDLGMIESAELNTASDGSATARAKILLTIAGCPAADRIEADVLAALEEASGAGNATVEVGIMSPQQRQELIERLRGGKRRVNPFAEPGSLTRVIAVTSGKGGVGKSTITANLAVGLAVQGFKVGVLDADVYGFSIPAQLGITGGPTKLDDMMVPPIGHEVKAISIGMFAGSEHAVSWRGPMLQRTLSQFLTDVYFGDLDFLLIDMPPGTGDVAITVGQMLPGAEILVVTTPQSAASDVAVRAGMLAAQLEQQIIGVVENMSWQSVTDGSGGVSKLEIFGAGGGVRAAEKLSDIAQYSVPVLAQIPLSIPMRESADGGTPVVLRDANDEAAQVLLELTERIAKRPSGIAGKKLSVSPK